MNAEDLQQYNVAQLREYLKKLKKSTTGVKQDLLDRAVATLEGHPSDGNNPSAEAKVSGVDTVCAAQTSDNGTGVYTTAPSSDVQPPSGGDVTVTSDPSTRRRESKSPYQQARQEAMQELWSKAQEDGDVAEQHQASLVLRAQAIEEKFRLQREEEKLREAEHKLQQELEDQEWKEKLELMERERDMRKNRELLERSRRLELAKKRRDIREQQELLLLTLPDDDEVKALNAELDDVKPNTQVLSKLHTSATSGSVPKHVDSSMHKVNVAKPVVSFKTADDARPNTDTEFDGSHVARGEHRLYSTTRGHPRSAQAHSPVRKQPSRYVYESDYDIESEDEYALHKKVRSARGTVRGRDELQEHYASNDGRHTRSPDRHTTSTPRGVIHEPAQISNVSHDESFRQLVDLMNLPKVSMMTFDGDPMQYHIFMNAFNTCIDSANVPPASKLNRLFELCKGKARTVINPCALGDATAGYERAKKLLKERFGDDYVISEAWVSKITSGPDVKGNNSDSLQAFTDDVRGCVETLRSMDRLQEVDTRSRLVQLMQRLPENLQSRWRKKAVASRDATGKYPDIELFLEFLDGVTRETNDPVFGIQVRPKVNDSRPNNKQQQRSRQGRSLATEAQVPVVESKPADTGTDNEQREVTICPSCSKHHPLYACAEFKRMSAQKRLDFVREKKLCYSCLKAAKHGFRSCRVERICGIDGCTSNHSRFLHAGFSEAQNPTQEENKHATSADTKGTTSNQGSVSAHASVSMAGAQDNTKTALPVVGVKVSSLEGESTDVYALLDSGSDRTFCSPTLLENLKTTGRPTTFTLSTLNEGTELDVLEASLSVSPLATINDDTVAEQMHLPEVYAVDTFPTLSGSIANSSDVSDYVHLRDLPIPTVEPKSVQLLIGQDNPDALIPLETRRGKVNEPYAVRTSLGWSINGPINSGNDRSGFCHALLHDSTEEDEPALSGARAMSVSDRKALEVWNKSLEVKDGHYVLSIPFKQTPPDLPDNKYMAAKRFEYLRRRMNSNPEFSQRYRDNMQAYIDAGYAERVHENTGSKGMVWYIPHHAVFNAKKPEKLRIVFDCAAEYKNVSINNAVHRGPDLTNKLLGVLLRFREKPYVIVADVEAMYHQVRVTPAHRDVLRFLWFDGDDVVTYRMCVHVFGGVWSASVANYAIKRAAEDHRDAFDKQVTDAVTQNFYVDDLLQSTDTVHEAVQMAAKLRELLSLRGFNLTKWMSNSREVLQSIPAEHHTKTVKDMDLEENPLPKERALGVSWSAEDDKLQISIGPKTPKFTKRGLLAHYSSVYDPLGMVTPFVLIARLLYRKECKLNKGWDDDLEHETRQKFERWLSKLADMEEVAIPRCISERVMTNARCVQLHHFCDASEQAYAAVSYMRVVHDDGSIHCSYLFGKAKLAPSKTDTIPRLELQAAVLAAQSHLLLADEMTIKFDEVHFWSDSMVVLGWLNNTESCLPMYVARRVASIIEVSSPEQWHHVPTNQNPADVGSRGSFDVSEWLTAPAFLLTDEWPTSPLGFKQAQTSCVESDVSENNIDGLPEDVTGCSYAATVDKADSNPTERLVHYFSSIRKLKRSVVWLAKFCSWLKQKNERVDDITVSELDQAETNVVRYVQRSAYSHDYNNLKSGRPVSRQSKLFALEPQMDNDDVMRVGGRLAHAELNANAKNQILMPADHHVTMLFVRHVHYVTCMHSGKEHVLAVLRERFWIPRARRLIRRIIRSCITCKRLAARAITPKMADLPPERLAISQRPFTNVGIDCFGPILVNRGRGTVKRYGIIFTCMTIRAIHLEILPDLSADAFIDALRRFICRRGQPKRLVSDNGTNFVGAYRQLGNALKDTSGSRKLRAYLQSSAIEWRFNPPAASHFGGVWERLIRSVRRAYNATMYHGFLSDYELQTVTCEIEAVVNSRPVTHVSDDKDDDEPLTPSHLLALGRTAAPPPVVGSEGDQYRRRWRYIQHLVDRFWKRWVREYLPTIQHRRKWLHDTPNTHVGDIVLVMDELTHRNQWPMGRVIKVNTGRDGVVRSCDVKTEKGRCTRPVTKLCLLEAGES